MRRSDSLASSLGSWINPPLRSAAVVISFANVQELRTPRFLNASASSSSTSGRRSRLPIEISYRPAGEATPMYCVGMTRRGLPSMLDKALRGAGEPAAGVDGGEEPHPEIIAIATVAAKARPEFDLMEIMVRLRET